LRSQGIVPGSDEGGTASGFFTGGTGVTVYRGDAFPAEFHGNLFVAVELGRERVPPPGARGHGLARSGSGPRLPGIAIHAAAAAVRNRRLRGIGMRPATPGNGPRG